MEKKQLEIGDYVYSYQRWGKGLIRTQITHVTPKQATAGHLKMKRDVEYHTSYGGTARPEVKAIGEFGWLSVETPELLDRWTKEQLIKKAYHLHSNFKSDMITAENAQSIIDFYSTIQTLKTDNDE